MLEPSAQASEPLPPVAAQDVSTSETTTPAILVEPSTSGPPIPAVSQNPSTSKTLIPAVPPNKSPGEPLIPGVSQVKSSTESDTILQDVLDTMHDSDIFPRIGKDAPSRFWTAYERLAKQYDDEFLDRHNGNMDVLLIFAGLFSAVSSTFIVNLEPNLTPNESKTTNILLMILINKVDNGTFPEKDVSLPVFQGPSATDIWIQTLAHASLSTSLLAAFGAVLAKQWLGYFKTSHFGGGALHERCKHRQLKLDGLKAWHFSTIVATLPIFLQLSLLFFGIALSANLWTQQHTVASVIIATTAFGVIFYSFTVVASLKSPDCPFQTPVSIVLQRMPGVLQHASKGIIGLGNVVRNKWDEGPKSWACSLRSLLSSVRACLKNGLHAVIISFPGYFTRSLRRNRRLPIDDPESARASESPSGDFERLSYPEEMDHLDLGYLKSPVELAEIHAVQWVLERSTDTDIITAAARMVPEIEWPEDVTGVLDRLDSHLYGSFDPARQLPFLTQERAVACVKAMYHIYVERNMETPFFIGDGDIYSYDHHYLYQMHGEQGFLLIACAVDDPNELDITSLTVSDRTWMAHMFTYRLHDGTISPKAVTFVLDFICICLLDPNPPGRLVADCLLLAALLMGLRIDRQQLARLDKSAAIETLRQSVMSRLLAVLLGEVPDSLQGTRYTQIARRLFQPLVQDRHRSIANPDELSDRRMSERFLKLCFRLLEEMQGTEGGHYLQSKDIVQSHEGDQVQFRDIAILLRFSLNLSPLLDDSNWYLAFELGPYDWHTPEQFDLLVDYHAHVCDGTDYRAIFDTFVVLAGLHRSPNTPERQRHYVQTTIQFMDPAMPRRVRYAALNAALSVRTMIAFMGREDEGLREDFSQALSSAVLGLQPTITPVDKNTFNTAFFSQSGRNLCYLRLLRTLAQEPAWRGQLYKAGHFDNCLGIADALSTRRGDIFGPYAVHVAHIIAIVDAVGEENQILNMSIQIYPIWPLVLQAWHFIFGLEFFDSTTEGNLMRLSSTGYLEALLSLVAYGRRRWGNQVEKGCLFALVEQVFKKLEEERQQNQLGVGQRIENDNSFGHGGIPSLGKDIRDLVKVLQETAAN